MLHPINPPADTASPTCFGSLIVMHQQSFSSASGVENGNGPDSRCAFKEWSPFSAFYGLGHGHRSAAKSKSNGSKYVSDSSQREIICDGCYGPRSDFSKKLLTHG